MENNHAPASGVVNKGGPKPAGRLMAGGLAAAAFASLLAVVTNHLEGENARNATLCFAAALPILCSHLVLATDDPDRHHVSFLMRLIWVGGVFLAFAGIAELVFMLGTAQGSLFMLSTLGCVGVVVKAEDRAKKILARTKARVAGNRSPTCATAEVTIDRGNGG